MGGNELGINQNYKKMTNNENLINILHAQVKPALGCTEPIAVALAVAKARESLAGELKELKVVVSPNIYKNGFHVTIPGTKKTGISFAAALSLLIGKSEFGLEVLKNAEKKDYIEADKLLKFIDLDYHDTDSQVYVYVKLSTDKGCSEVIIKEKHDNIISVKVNDKVIFKEESSQGKNENYKISTIPIKKLITEIENIEVSGLRFLLAGVNMNKKIAYKGLSEKSGMGLGRGIKELIEEGVLTDSVVNKAKMLSAAAADARMGGIKMPVMSSAGSGNQGITAILPIYVVSDYYDLSEDKLVKALAISHLLTKYVKEYTGDLTPICGCAVAAGVGAVAGITWILGGTYKQINGAINNIIASLAGMICDGAKHSCALKIATSANEAVTLAHLALREKYLAKTNGIISKKAETTIENLGEICVRGMENMDKTILDIMGK